MSDKIREAITVARTFAATKRDIGEVEKAHILGLCNILDTALSKQPSTAVPEGWKLVPVKPTPEMLAATTTAKHEVLRAEVMRMAGEDYIAMLAAAPAAPVAVGQEPIKLNDDVREFLAEWIGSALEDDDHDFARQLEMLLGPIYDAPPSAEQPYSTTSDQYRAELYDEVWEKARGMGYGNVTEALAELQRMKIDEQPDTVNVLRPTLARYADHLQTAGYNNAADDLRALLAGGAE